MGAATVLVTGGSGGIGAAIVRRLVAERSDDLQVAFTFRSGEAAARKLEAECAGRAAAYPLDLRDRQAPDSLVERIEQAQGPLAGLVNNAGTRIDGLLAMTSDEAWDEVIDTNLGGTFRLCRAAVRGMVSRRAGSIVNIASLSAQHGVAGQAAYSASKAGVLALTRVLAREVGKRKIRVNAIVPGYVETEMTGGLREDQVQALRAGEVLPQGVSPADVAGVADFLLSDASAAITGQTLVVDAGCSA